MVFKKIRGLGFESFDGRKSIFNVRVPTGFCERFRGLLGHPSPGAGEGLLFEHCSSVHCFGMAYPIDLVFLSDRLEVMEVVHALKPWRFAWSSGARHVLELGEGEITRAGIRAGDQFSWA